MAEAEEAGLVTNGVPVVCKPTPQVSSINFMVVYHKVLTPVINATCSGVCVLDLSGVCDVQARRNCALSGDVCQTIRNSVCSQGSTPQ